MLLEWSARGQPRGTQSWFKVAKYVTKICNKVVGGPVPGKRRDGISGQSTTTSRAKAGGWNVCAAWRGLSQGEVFASRTTGDWLLSSLLPSYLPPTPELPLWQLHHLRVSYSPCSQVLLSLLPGASRFPVLIHLQTSPMPGPLLHCPRVAALTLANRSIDQ